MPVRAMQTWRMTTHPCPNRVHRQRAAWLVLVTFASAAPLGAQSNALHTSSSIHHTTTASPPITEGNALRKRAAIAGAVPSARHRDFAGRVVKVRLTATQKSVAGRFISMDDDQLVVSIDGVRKAFPLATVRQISIVNSKRERIAMIAGLIGVVVCTILFKTYDDD